MLITLIADRCIPHEKPSVQTTVKSGFGSKEPRSIHKVAPFADAIVGITLLVLGFLGVTGMIPISAAASYAVFGAGLTYTIITAVKFSEFVRFSVNVESK